MNTRNGPEGSPPSFEFRISSFISVMALLLFVGAGAYSREKPKEPEFSYAGGTENVLEGCKGTLELTSEALTFKCAQFSITAPYTSVNLMQYRPDISGRVRKMRLRWKVKPPGGGGKRNRYFTVLYSEQGVTHAMVLEVSPQSMRPYLAEIDLKAGKGVEVKSYEEYDR